MEAMRYIPRRKQHGCSDRMCGAEDCPTCYPGRMFVDEEEDIDPPYEDLPSDDDIQDAENAWERQREARYD